MTSVRHYTVSDMTPFAVGLGTGIVSYGLLWWLLPSDVIPAAELSLTYGLFLVFVPLGIVLTLGIPVAAFYSHRVVGPLITLGLVGSFWVSLAFYTGDRTLLATAPSLWLFYLALYVRSIAVVDVFYRRPDSFRMVNLSDT